MNHGPRKSGSRGPARAPVALRPAHGATLVESLVVLGLAAVVLGIQMSVHSFGARASHATLEEDTATRSLLLAIESITRDVREMTCRDAARDLVIGAGGRRLSVLRPRRGSRDLWSVDLEVVTYSLEDATGAPAAKRLVRRDRRGARPVAGCWLDDLVVRSLASSDLAAGGLLMQVTVVTRTDRGARRSASRLLRVPAAPVPPARELRGAQE